MKLIDKDAVVAEIEKLMYGFNLEADIASTGECFNEEVANAKYKLCKQIKEKINTLEVKEVDLEKEIDNIWNPRFNLGWDENSLLSLNHKGFTTIAKYFFELGLKAQKGE